MISGPGLVCLLCLAYASFPLLRIGVVFTYEHLRDSFHTEEREEAYECFRQVESVRRSSNDFRQVVCSQSNCIIHKHTHTHTKKSDEEWVTKHFHSPNKSERGVI